MVCSHMARQIVDHCAGDVRKVNGCLTEWNAMLPFTDFKALEKKRMSDEILL